MSTISLKNIIGFYQIRRIRKDRFDELAKIDNVLIIWLYVRKNEISGFYGTYVPLHSVDIAAQTVTSFKDKHFAETFQALVPAAVVKSYIENFSSGS